MPANSRWYLIRRLKG